MDPEAREVMEYEQEAACISAAREACAAVRPHLGRVYSLEYFGSFPLLFPLPNTPALRHLQVAPSAMIRGENRIPGFFQCMPPMLRSLSWQDTGNTTLFDTAEDLFLHVPASQIDALDLSSLSVRDGSLDFVHKCTNLRSIIIRDTLRPSHEEPKLHFTSLAGMETLWTLSHLYTRVASAPSLVHLRSRGHVTFRLDQGAATSSEGLTLKWPRFSRLRSLQLRLQDAQVEYLIKTLEHCPELEAMHLDGSTGFRRFLQRFVDDSEGRCGGQEAEGPERRSALMLSPKLKLLRLEAIEETFLSTFHGNGATLGEEGFVMVWPLMQRLLQQRAHLVVCIWTMATSSFERNLWAVEEVRTLASDHSFGDRFRVISGPHMQVLPLADMLWSE